ncbi:MAG: Ig-like domain-containing protein, partial [Pseudohongiella sp.]|nr:Ig-like domain-containing protein [Pseudohongiella sp.]
TTDASYDIRVRQTDLAGNSSGEGSLTFTLDTTAPTAVNSLSFYDSGSSNSDKITNSGYISVSGLQSNVTLQYSLDNGSSWNQGEISGTYTFMGRVTVSGDGEKNVLIRQIDTAGNASANSSVSFTLDTTAPVTPAIGFTDSGSSSTDLITNSGVITVGEIEENASWQYSLNAGSSWTTGSGSSFTVTTAATYDVRVRQTDVAGNVSSQASLAFTLDVTAAEGFPALTKDSGTSASDHYTNDGRVTVTGIESDATWEYRIGNDSGAQWVSGSGNSFEVNGANNGGSDGAKLVYVRQTDVAGNVSTERALSFTLDTIVPASPSVTLSFDSGSSDSDWVTSSATILISNLESDARWEYKPGDSSEWISVSGSTLRFEEDDNYNLQVRQIDKAGNVSEESLFSFTLDTTVDAPTVSLVNDSGASDSDRISNDGRVSVDGLENDASWQFSLNGGSSWTTGEGSSFEVTTDSSYDIRVRQTDLAGNSS